jgi:WD40 repeat protein
MVPRVPEPWGTGGRPKAPDAPRRWSSPRACDTDGDMGRRLIVGGLAVVALLSVVLVLPRVSPHLPHSLATVANLPERLMARASPPRVPRKVRLAGLTRAERNAVDALARELDGLVVWSSNRTGNHELYLLDLRTRTLRQLTHTPQVEFFSRFSPDGRRIVFTRSQREYVSPREPTAWDVYVMNVDGTDERLLARGGYWPQWTPKGDAIIFVRGNQVIRLDLVGGSAGRESVLLDGPTTEGIGGGMETPELSPDGTRLAMTIRSREYGGVGVVDLGTRAVTRLSPGQACQITWMPGSDALLWVEPEGNGGTEILTGGPGRARGVFMDLPGAYSHEYFPRVSRDGRWLIWAAAATGHEHDRADYEIFIWPIGRPVSEAVRLTYHEGNDQWPDIYVPR